MTPKSLMGILKITELEILRFRNLPEVRLVPGAKFNLLIGENGQGKTNFLEAIYSALRGKSFRPYVSRKNWLPHLPAQAAGERSLESPLDELSENLQVNLKIENRRGYTTDLRLLHGLDVGWSIRFNDKKISPTRINELVPVVAFSPEDHAIIRGSPELRREYLDEVFADVCPGYGDVLTRFNRALKQRNLLLKRAEGSKHRVGPEMSAWTKVFAEAGLELMELREEVWPAFSSHYRNVAGRLLADFAPNLEIRFLSHLDSCPDSKPEVSVETYTKFIEERIEADLATGWTHRGPHRDDFSILLGGVECRAGASQGQARLLALVLKWVHAEWVRRERQELPIFLIDDFSSELDAKRRKLLLGLVSELSGQVFVTSTDDSLVASLVDFTPFSEYTLFNVNKGVVRSVKNCENPNFDEDLAVSPVVSPQ